MANKNVISRTEAKRKYRLSNSDLNKLKLFPKGPSSSGYKITEVLSLAYEKFGGEEEFEKRQQELEEKRIERQANLEQKLKYLDLYCTFSPEFLFKLKLLDLELASQFD